MGRELGPYLKNTKRKFVQDFDAKADLWHSTLELFTPLLLFFLETNL